MESRTRIMYIKSHTKFFKAILPFKQGNESRQILMKAFKMSNQNIPLHMAIKNICRLNELLWS